MARLIGSRAKADRATTYPGGRLPGVEKTDVVGRIVEIDATTEVYYGDSFAIPRVGLIDDAGERWEADPNDLEIL